jgi:hypothetical protein
MEPEPTEQSPYLPATSPEWVPYYKRARLARRLGKGEHARIQADAKRRRRRANLIVLTSTAVLCALVAGFCLVFGQ